MIDLEALERDVRSNLQNARTNGYHLEQLTPMEIADDMLTCTNMLDVYGLDENSLQALVVAVVVKERQRVNHDIHLMS